MNRKPASSRAFRLAAESMPASATMTKSASWCRSRKASMIGISVVVSALLPSKQPISSGKPCRSTSSPTTICGSTRRSLE